MSVINKLNYLKETKEKIKDAINYDFVKISEETPFRNYADKILEIEESYKKYIPTIKESGNSLSLKDVIPIKPKSFIIDGNCYHETSEQSKNLIDIPEIEEQTINGLTISYSKKTNILKLNGQIESGNKQLELKL